MNMLDLDRIYHLDNEEETWAYDEYVEHLPFYKTNLVVVSTYIKDPHNDPLWLKCFAMNTSIDGEEVKTRLVSVIDSKNPTSFSNPTIIDIDKNDIRSIMVTSESITYISWLLGNADLSTFTKNEDGSLTRHILHRNRKATITLNKGCLYLNHED